MVGGLEKNKSITYENYSSQMLLHCEALKKRQVALIFHIEKSGTLKGDPTPTEPWQNVYENRGIDPHVISVMDAPVAINSTTTVLQTLTWLLLQKTLDAVLNSALYASQIYQELFSPLFWFRRNQRGYSASSWVLTPQ